MTTATRLASPVTYIPLSTARTVDGGLDLIAVERAVNNELPEGITDAELARAARILHERDVSLAEIGRRLDVSQDAIKTLKNKNWDPDVLANRRRNAERGTVQGPMRHVLRKETISETCAHATVSPTTCAPALGAAS
ncbi:hypothetical protein [Streptomyces lutosisoli]|uniref:RNA polymerase sigma-70 region 4 domain-containing protein n=1 Tax=Streptomyces lutosisoli TaxID=2665721 RepID=A0ABW2VTP4_9ACTN